jgi:thiamine-monophosphate kinase
MPKRDPGTGSENGIIQFLQDRYSKPDPSIKKGIGDDAAVIRRGKSGEYWLVTTDMLVEGIDFRLDWITPRQLGAKSISANLSDIAAMGGRPRFYTVSLGIPPRMPGRWISEFYRGLTQQGFRYGALLIGGDLSSVRESITVSIAMLGESVGRKVLYRSGGGRNDLLYVTGTLGRSDAGLRLLQQGVKRPGSRPGKQAIRAHLQPDPRCEAGLWLAQSGLVRCMMDLSDGLSADLPRLCAASGTSAEVDTSLLPVFREAEKWDLDPLHSALHGGEDFELLFAVKKNRAALFEKSYPRSLPPATRIGRMTGGGGEVWVISAGRNRQRLDSLGYDHFR